MFDSYIDEQQQGNTAFNKRSYEIALFHYINAKNHLDAIKEGKIEEQGLFIEYYVCMIRQIIDTIARQLKKITIENLSNANNLWHLIPGLVIDMEKKSSCLKKCYLPTKDKNSIFNKINEVFSQLATISEHTSDRAFKKNESLTNQKGCKLEALNQAQLWMERVLEYRQKTKDKNIPINVHLGYLNILYQQYQLNHKDHFLSTMAIHIKKHDLLPIKLNSNTRLELLGYAIISNCTDKTHKKQLLKEGMLLIAYSNIENLYLVDDFKNIAATTTFYVKDFMKMVIAEEIKHNNVVPFKKRKVEKTISNNKEQTPVGEEIVPDSNKPFKKRKVLKLLFSVNMLENPEISQNKSQTTMTSSTNSH